MTYFKQKTESTYFRKRHVAPARTAFNRVDISAVVAMLIFNDATDLFEDGSLFYGIVNPDGFLAGRKNFLLLRIPKSFSGKEY